MAVVASLYGAPFIQKYFHVSISSSAAVITMMWIGIAIGAPIFGFISDKTKMPRVWLFITALIGAISFSMIMYSGLDSLFSLFVLFLLAGVSCAGQALSFSMVKNSNSIATQATAIGFNNMAVVIAGFIFQPLVGYVIERDSTGLTGGGYVYTGSDYFTGMLVILGCYILSTLISLFFIKSVRR